VVRTERKKIGTNDTETRYNSGEPHTETTYFCDNCGEQLLRTISHPIVGIYIAYFKEKICKCGKYKVWSWNKLLGFSYGKEDIVVCNGHQDVVITLNK